MSAAAMSTARLWAAYLGEIRVEFLKSLRTPAFSVPTLFFPIMFYLLFGVLLGSMRGNMEMSLYTFATYGVFGAMGPGLFGFGVSLAIEREQGLLTLKQALPQPAGAYLLARAVMAMLFVAIISVLLTAAALLIAKVPLSVGQVVQLFVINVLGALPFCAIGLFVGSWVSGQASPAIVNLIFLPMAFLSGLWWPLQFMPQFLQDIAPAWPAYHLAQMALATVGAPNEGSTVAHVVVLVAVTLGFFLLAVRRMHGGGFRLLGTSPKRTIAIATAASALILALSLAGVFGGKQVEKEDATAATDAASASTDTSAPSEGPPRGKAAPAEAVIADFDKGSDQSNYGMGMQAGGDEFQGGKSTATQRLVDGGAEGSKAALEITGEVKPATQYPSAGTFFFPEGPPMQGVMDYSAKKTLSFHARGDGKRYTLLIMSGTPMRMPPLMYPFTAGADWQKYELELAKFGAADFERVRLIGFISTDPGAFRFQIDDVRLQ
jgi:ABC-2 type transport system permease protein